MGSVMKACCGFGHRIVLENIQDKLNSIIFTAIMEGYEMFYTGAMGDFDNIFSATVRKIKLSHPQIKLVCIKPYFTNDINTNIKHYLSLYDDVFIPSKIIGIHYKSAIKFRNHFMIDKSDLVITYIIRNYGGAADAAKYAKRQNKRISTY